MEIKRFVNQLMTSNCFLLIDSNKHCVVIDPASEKEEDVIAEIESRGLTPDYIILTHEHTDHNWGVNVLRERYPEVQLVCTSECNVRMAKINKMYFLLYFNRKGYSYVIAPAEVLVERDGQELDWQGHTFRFHLTPGHSWGSMCIQLDHRLFTGDTLMPYPPYFGKDSDKEEWTRSVKKIKDGFPIDTEVYPGHGDALTLEEWIGKYDTSK